MGSKLITMGSFDTEEKAAEAADYIRIQMGLEAINFPDRTASYRNKDYRPPKTLRQAKKSSSYKYVSFRANKYVVDIDIQSLSQRFTNYFETEQEAIAWRNKILAENGRTLPDDRPFTIMSIKTKASMRGRRP